MDDPGTVRVTPVYGDTLTWGVYKSGYPWMVRSDMGGIYVLVAVAIHGCSGHCQSNSDVRTGIL